MDPTFTSFLSPMTTALYHIDVWLLTLTSPSTVAEGATNASGGMNGYFPLEGITLRCFTYCGEVIASEGNENSRVAAANGNCARCIFPWLCDMTSVHIRDRAAIL